MEAIKIRTLKKYFDGFSLDKIRLDIPKGKITGLVGENGAGKTTLIKLIVGSLKPDGGSIWVNGKELKANREEILNEVYVIMDEPLLMDALIASEYNLMMKEIFQHWDEKEFYAYLEKFELPLDKQVGDFSKGMKMKFNFALALSTNPDILILDEATSGLDPFIRDDILDLVRSYAKQKDRSVLFSSHIVSDMDRVADHLIFIHDGKIVIDEDKEPLLRRYDMDRLEDLITVIGRMLKHDGRAKSFEK